MRLLLDPGPRSWCPGPVHATWTHRQRAAYSPLSGTEGTLAPSHACKRSLRAHANCGGSRRVSRMIAPANDARRKSSLSEYTIILRRDQCVRTSVKRVVLTETPMMRRPMSLGGKTQLSPPTHMLQIVCGCQDGGLRLFILHEQTGKFLCCARDAKGRHEPPCHAQKRARTKAIKQESGSNVAAQTGTQRSSGAASCCSRV